MIMIDNFKELEGVLMNTVMLLSGNNNPVLPRLNKEQKIQAEKNLLFHIPCLFRLIEELCREIEKKPQEKRVRGKNKKVNMEMFNLMKGIEYHLIRKPFKAKGDYYLNNNFEITCEKKFKSDDKKKLRDYLERERYC